MGLDMSQYNGVGLGLLIGDAHCAPYEGGIFERMLWSIIGRTLKGKRRYTDDSQMALDLAYHLIAHGHIDPQELAQKFAHSYRWSRGYGPSTIAVLKQVKKGRNWKKASRYKFKEGSFGNGAAMRVPIIPIVLHDKMSTTELLAWVRHSSEITHPNPLAIDGSIAVALCVWNALEGYDPIKNISSLSDFLVTSEMKGKIATLVDWLESGSPPGIKSAKESIGAGTAAVESCPMAIYIALRTKKDFGSLLESCNQTTGDTDTIGAMAGAIWGAYNGGHSIPSKFLENTEGVEEMIEVVGKLRNWHPKRN